MRGTPTWLAIVLTAALALGSCDGGSGDENPDGAGSDSDPTGTYSEDEPAPTQDEMRSALLTLQDMPAGWSVADYDPESKDNLCPAEVAEPLGLDREPPSVGAQYLANPTQGPSFSEAIQVVPGRGTELIPIVDEALADCDGKVYSGRTADVSELDFPTVGDESAAYTIKLDGLPIHAVYVVIGDIAIIMSTYDFTGGDPVDLLETYATQAVDKAEEVLG
jgi:hypothetical protein